MRPKDTLPLAVAFVATLVGCGEPPRRQAGPAWGVEGSYLTLDGEPSFLSGVNYVPSSGWLTHLDLWDRSAVDRDLAALKGIGVRAIRYLPLWHQLQPTRTGADPTALRRVDHVIDAAERHGIHVQLGMLNSWMSGGTFLPPWADGNLFTDPGIIAGQLALISELASRYGDRRIVQAFDLGNELNVLENQMRLDLDPADVDRWQRRIADEVRQNAPGSLVVNGVGTGYTSSFNIESIAGATDFMAAHSYPYFHGTSRLDPWLGQRTTYSTNYIIAWAGMTGKPVLMQELGASGQWVEPATIPKYLRLTLLSNWLEGAAGYLWWCSHDLPTDFRVSDDGLFKEYSTARVRRENRFSALNYDMGLLTNDNRPKPAAEAFESAVRLVERLGVDWEDRLPVCYVLVPADHEYESTMIELITPFALVKQAHMEVRLLPEGRPVPADASAVAIPGFALSAEGRRQIGDFLNGGGTVLQSYFKDFGAGIEVSDKDFPVTTPRLTAVARSGAMEVGQQLVLAVPTRVREVVAVFGAETILAIPKGERDAGRREEADTSWFGDQLGQGVLFRTSHGDGTYYYLAAKLEAALARTYDPWDRDDSDLVYSVLRPPHPVDVNSKHLELYHKARNGAELVSILNHSRGFVDAIVRIGPGVRAVDASRGNIVSQGEEVFVRVEPAGFRLMFLEPE